MNLPATNRKEALRLYAQSLQIQHHLHAKALSEPYYQLSFEESLQYLESLRNEQNARLHIGELFAAE